jgi:hypothetical protein
LLRGGEIASPYEGYTLAIAQDGTIYGIGYNGHGETGNGVANATDLVWATASPYALKLSNQAPSVTLSVNPSTSIALSNINLSANPTDSDGNISRVDFLQNGSLIQSLTGSPWQITVPQIGAGNYTFSVRAIDNMGTPAIASQNATVSLPIITLSTVVNNTQEGDTINKGIFRFTRNGGGGNLTVNYFRSSDSRSRVGLLSASW